MGNSAGALAEIETIERYPSGEIEVGGARKYQVRRDGEIAWHHEYVTDQTGQVAYDQSEAVRYAIGSGQRGRAYLIFQNGVFRQSPIGWYSTGATWDLSPGYAADSNQRFQRRIDDSCLYCHVGHLHPATPGRYAEPPFHEAAIGCERCHGPAADHVAMHQAGSIADPTADPIVNPAKLTIAARESVCNQCHLQGLYTIARYGRSFTDFRPGDQMEDVFVTLVGSQKTAGGEPSRVVSQVEQMQQSRCYTGSQQQLGCTSCHNPHAPAPTAKRDAYYRDRCNACHADRGCSLPEPERLSGLAQGSCVHCHMPSDPDTNVPHTAQTDHRILRDPSAQPRSGTPPTRHSGGGAELIVLGDPDLIPQWEQSRALGIAMMTRAWRTRDLVLARQAAIKLVPASVIQAGSDAMIAALTPDIAALNELASFFWLSDDHAKAGHCWSHVLELQPQDETALGGMVLVSRAMSEPAKARDYLDRLLKLTPEDPQWLTQKVELAWQRGEREQAFETAEKLLNVDPTLSELRQWLAHAYRSVGRDDDAQAHEQTLFRLGH